MLSADYIWKLDRKLQKVRVNKKFFGGMQVIFVGDFFQLPPVFKKLVVDPRRIYNAQDPTALLRETFAKPIPLPSTASCSSDCGPAAVERFCKRTRTCWLRSSPSRARLRRCPIWTSSSLAGSQPTLSIRSHHHASIPKPRPRPSTTRRSNWRSRNGSSIVAKRTQRPTGNTRTGNGSRTPLTRFSRGSDRTRAKHWFCTQGRWSCASRTSTPMIGKR
ncbi:hypothetical protein BC828DRAFT_230887 [Blastocladiella britannica]|nr:hypothetical protein BC828DRAFT_230887 [Blastocladiella britannica]